MKKYPYLMLATNRLLVLTMSFCGVVFVASCSKDDDNPSDDELFEQEMTAALADAQTYGSSTEAFAKEVAERFDGCGQKSTTRHVRVLHENASRMPADLTT